MVVKTIESGAVSQSWVTTQVDTTTAWIIIYIRNVSMYPYALYVIKLFFYVVYVIKRHQIRHSINAIFLFKRLWRNHKFTLNITVTAGMLANSYIVIQLFILVRSVSLCLIVLFHVILRRWPALFRPVPLPWYRFSGNSVLLFLRR